MKLYAVGFTRRGTALACRAAGLLDAGGHMCRVFAPGRIAAECRGGSGGLPILGMEGGVREWAGRAFREADGILFVGAAGIAVRAVAPHLRCKDRDPAVLVLDEAGRHVIPILSGHLGGANALALETARLLGAQPVITTGTDVNGRFACDVWAKENGLSVVNLGAVKLVSGALLRGERVGLKTEIPVSGALPEGVSHQEGGEVGICVSIREERPFQETLLLAPRAVVLGIGCRRGASKDDIETAVRAVLKERRILPEAVRAAASVDLKKDEGGLIAFCAERGILFSTYSAEELLVVPGAFSQSRFVKSVAGVDCVCERAALRAARDGTLIVPKTAVGPVTVAAAVDAAGPLHFE